MKIFIHKCMLDQVMHEKNLDREEETEKKWAEFLSEVAFLFSCTIVSF